MNNKKDLLFYSNYCEFSKEVLTFLTKKNVRNIFLLVCIDTGKYKVPPIITSVPTILTADYKSIICENDIYKYIENILQSMRPKEESLQTFSWEGNSYSESYALLNEEESQNINDFGNISSKGYTFINGNDIEQMNTKSKIQDDDDVLKQTKFDISAYDKYISSRNKDEEYIKRQYQPNNFDRM